MAINPFQSISVEMRKLKQEYNNILHNGGDLESAIQKANSRINSIRELVGRLSLDHKEQLTRALATASREQTHDEAKRVAFTPEFELRETVHFGPDGKDAANQTFRVLRHRYRRLPTFEPTVRTFDAVMDRLYDHHKSFVEGYQRLRTTTAAKEQRGRALKKYVKAGKSVPFGLMVLLGNALPALMGDPSGYTTVRLGAAAVEGALAA